MLSRVSIRSFGPVLLLTGTLLLTPHRAFGTTFLDGYAWPVSVTQGDTVHICVSTDAAALDLTILRDGSLPIPYLTVTGLPGTVQPVPPQVWTDGCGWSPTYTLVVPAAWPSGVYEAKLVAPDFTETRYAIFTVRESQPGSTSSILFQNSVNTWEAYNNWGGKSLYEHSSGDGERARIVSFRRPYAKGRGRGDFPDNERKLVQFLERQGYTLEYCTDIDTHRDPTLQDHYALFLSAGHDEYWSKEMRDNIEGRIAGGKNVAFFGGNTCWWQIRYSPGFDQVICYKDKDEDPLLGVDDSRVTVNWYKAPVYRPENSMTGVSFRHGGYVNEGQCLPASQGYGGYTACRTWHWVYAGTGLAEGEVFGAPTTIVGYEVDGAEIEMVGGLPVPSCQDGTPATFTVVATSPACEGSSSSFPDDDRHATMGCYSAGGTVFQAATMEWSAGLAGDPVVQQITRNVVDRLLVMPRVGVGDDGISGPVRLRLRFAPNPARGPTRIEFALDRPGPVRLEIFDARGSLVRDLVQATLGPGPQSVTWSGEDGRGRPAAAGVYLLRLDTPEGVATGTLMRLH